MNKKTIIIGALVIIAVALSYLNVFPETGPIKMVFSIILMVSGFIMLIKGADVFVDGASKIATKFNIPQMVIGLTIVAFGTSLPEAAISIKGAFSGNVGITVGNVVGSNIMNILLILGISSCIAALPIKQNTLKIEIPFVIFITVLLLGLGVLGSDLSRMDGIIFIILLFGAIALISFISVIKKNTEVEDCMSSIKKSKEEIKKLENRLYEITQKQ